MPSAAGDVDAIGISCWQANLLRQKNSGAEPTRSRQRNRVTSITPATTALSGLTLQPTRGAKSEPLDPDLAVG